MKRYFPITLAGSLIILLLNIVSGIITARALGPEGKGILRTLIVWPILFSQLSILGMNEAYVYLKSKTRVPIALKSTVFFGVLLSSILFSAVVLLLFSTVFKNTVKSPFLFLVISGYIPVANSIQVGLSFLQEKMYFFKYNILRVLVPFIYIALLLINHNHLTPEKCFVFLFFSNFLLFSIMLPYFLKLKPSYITQDSIKKVLRFGIKTQLASILGSFTQQTDQAILSLMTSPGLLGIYAVAASIGKLGAIAPNAAQIVLYPEMTKEKNYSPLKNIFYLIIFNLCLYILLLVFIHKLILVFYGTQFSGSAKLALILFLSSFPLSVLYVGTAFFKSIGKPGKTAIAQSIVFIFVLLLVPLLYKIKGLYGVSAALPVAYSMGATYYILNIKRHYGDRG